MTRMLTAVTALCVLTFLATTMLTGCNVRNEAEEQQRADARVQLFNACMELSAKMPRQSDDDVARIVDSCDSTSYYQAGQMIFAAPKRDMK